MTETFTPKFVNKALSSSSDNFLFIPFKPIFSLFFECIENKVPLLISLSINNNDFFPLFLIKGFS